MISSRNEIPQIKELAGLPKGHFDRYYQPIIDKLHDLSSNPERALSLALRALRRRRGYQLPPGAAPEDVIKRQEVWTYGVFSAGLLGVLSEGLEDCERLLNAGRIMPGCGLDWLRDDRELFTLWKAAVAGRALEAGPLAAILEMPAADRSGAAPEPISETEAVSVPVAVPEKPEHTANDHRPADDHPGKRFWDWLGAKLAAGEPVPSAHELPEGRLLASPDIFQDFLAESGQEIAWETVQKRFLRLKLHQRTGDGLNIHARIINGKKIHGILLPP